MSSIQCGGMCDAFYMHVEFAVARGICGMQQAIICNMHRLLFITSHKLISKFPRESNICNKGTCVYGTFRIYSCF